jgi:MFS transporter, DHA1 family, multidrug resistance protein
LNWKIILTIIVTNVVLSSASYTMLTPFLPIYLVRELGVNLEDITIWSGAIFSISFFVGAILASFWGRLADKRGKKLMAVRYNDSIGHRV